MEGGFPKVDCERLHPGLPVRDVAAAVEFYTTRLGFKLGFAWPEDGPVTFAGVNLGDVKDVQIFLARGTPNPDGIDVYFVVSDADALCEAQRAHGVEIVVEPGDRNYGLRDYSARDLNGYRLTFGHYIECEPQRGRR